MSKEYSCTLLQIAMSNEAQLNNDTLLTSLNLRMKSLEMSSTLPWLAIEHNCMGLAALQKMTNSALGLGVFPGGSFKSTDGRREFNLQASNNLEASNFHTNTPTRPQM